MKKYGFGISELVTGSCEQQDSLLICSSDQTPNLESIAYRFGLLKLNLFKNQTRQNNDNRIVHSHQKSIFLSFITSNWLFIIEIVVSGLGVTVRSDEQVTKLYLTYCS